MILEVALLDVLPGRTQGVGKSFAEASKIISCRAGLLIPRAAALHRDP